MREQLSIAPDNPCPENSYRAVYPPSHTQECTERSETNMPLNIQPDTLARLSPRAAGLASFCLSGCFSNTQWPGVIRWKANGEIGGTADLLVGRGPAPGSEAKQGLKSGHRKFAPIVAKDKFVEIHLQLLASGADSSRIKGVPFVSADTEPAVFLARRPGAQRAPDARAIQNGGFAGDDRHSAHAPILLPTSHSFSVQLSARKKGS